MQKRKIFFSFILSALLSILLYIVLHEAGHCIVAILCGATITEFSILSAHMNYSGGDFTALSALFLSANGILFPLFLSYIYAFLYRAAAKNKIYRMMSFFLHTNTDFFIITLGGSANSIQVRLCVCRE